MLDDKFMGRWRQVFGDSVLDFDSGQGDEARMLRAKGIRVTEFEPYPCALRPTCPTRTESAWSCVSRPGRLFPAAGISSGAGLMQDRTFHGFASTFDSHVREQLPWYELASAAMGLIARKYIPKGGKVYDLGASTGNVGRVLAPVLEARSATLTALDDCPDMIAAYAASGRAVVADMTRFAYKPFDTAVAFLALMFLAVPARRKLLARLR